LYFYWFLALCPLLYTLTTAAHKLSYATKKKSFLCWTGQETLLSLRRHLQICDLSKFIQGSTDMKIGRWKIYSLFWVAETSNFSFLKLFHVTGSRMRPGVVVLQNDTRLHSSWVDKRLWISTPFTPTANENEPLPSVLGANRQLWNHVHDANATDARSSRSPWAERLRLASFKAKIVNTFCTAFLLSNHCLLIVLPFDARVSYYRYRR
jgi:hypothetical protein